MHQALQVAEEAWIAGLNGFRPLKFYLTALSQQSSNCRHHPDAMVAKGVDPCTCLLYTSLAIFQSGQKQLPPTLPITFDYYREYPEKESISATSLDDLRFLITFTLKSQQEFTHVFELFKGYLHERRK